MAQSEQHFEQPTSAYSDEPDSELECATEHEADTEILASPVLRRSSRVSKCREIADHESAHDQTVQVIQIQMPLKKQCEIFVKTFR